MTPEESHSGLLLAMRYQVGDTMRHGAISTIYRGLDTVLKRPIVVKAIPSEHAPAFRKALQLTSDLTHPAIVATYDAVELDQWLFLIQESISARSLDVYLPDGIPVGRALDLTAQLARALAYAHSHDVIHGDLTPTAILVDRRATIRINNFALPPDTRYFSWAAATLPDENGDAAAATDNNRIPQGVEGDVWAAGLLLWQLLSVPDSHLPVASDEGQPAKRGFREEVPPEVRELVLRCVRLNRRRRIKNAEALTLALEKEKEAHSLAGGRRAFAEATPPTLRAARAAVAHTASWSTEDTQGSTQRRSTSESPAKPPRTVAPRPSRRPTSPPQTARARVPSGKPLAEPKLRLPARRGTNPVDVHPTDAAQRLYQDELEPAEPRVLFGVDGDRTDPRVSTDEVKYAIHGGTAASGPTTLVVVVLAMVLFLVFFVIGFILAALPLGH